MGRSLYISKQFEGYLEHTLPQMSLDDYSTKCVAWGIWYMEIAWVQGEVRNMGSSYYSRVSIYVVWHNCDKNSMKCQWCR